MLRESKRVESLPTITDNGREGGTMTLEELELVFNQLTRILHDARLLMV